MSGYTDETVMRKVANTDASFLHKPFTPAALAERIRTVLDAAAAARSRPGYPGDRSDES
jgi:DNA-binding response OmpR family regulator